MIRERDEWRCIFCGTHYEPPTNALHCSHFWSRQHKATRFSALNCDALCYGCHIRNEGDKQGYYRDYKLETLGKRVYNQLEKSARSSVKFGDKEKKEVYEELKRQYKNKEHLKENWKGIILPPMS